MPSYSCEVLVLRERPLGEADRLLTLLGRDRGCFRATARSVRKPGSRLAGALLPFSHSRLLLWQGRSLDGISQAQVLTGFRRLREELPLLSCASLAAEMVEAFGTELPPSGRGRTGIELQEYQRDFDLLLAFFRTLDDPDLEPDESTWALALFMTRHLAFAGYMPRIDLCLGCGRRLDASARFDPSAGGCYCLACGGGMDPPMDAGVIAAWRLLQGGRWAALRGRRPGAATLQQLEAALVAQAEAVLERPLKARKFRDIINAGRDNHAGE